MAPTKKHRTLDDRVNLLVMKSKEKQLKMTGTEDERRERSNLLLQIETIVQEAKATTNSERAADDNLAIGGYYYCDEDEWNQPSQKQINVINVNKH